MGAMRPAGKAHPMWKGGKTRHALGYVPIRIGGKYEVEHRVVMERKLGRRLLPTEVVHHRDGDVTNNDPSNLELLGGLGDHRRSHSPSPSASSVWRYLCRLARALADLPCRECQAKQAEIMDLAGRLDQCDYQVPEQVERVPVGLILGGLEEGMISYLDCRRALSRPVAQDIPAPATGRIDPPAERTVTALGRARQRSIVRRVLKRRAPDNRELVAKLRGGA